MTTTASTHDPLLFYPYGQTLYEVEQYYSTNRTNIDNDNMLCSSPSSSPSTSSVSSISSYGKRIHYEADWNHIMTNIKKTMYNTTSAVVPSPATYIFPTPFVPEPSKDPMLFYNSNPLEVKDMYSYRQLRSESLLYRMFNCNLMKVDADPSSIIRLSKGVFVANKSQKSTTMAVSPKTLPVEFLNDATFLDDTARLETIDTFHYGDMKRFMLQQQKIEQQQHNNFIPFSYTFGARYTNPYHGRDVVIRGGQLPMWCQTLFLNECVNRMPLQPNVPYTGLFPFAPSLIVVFQSLSSVVSSSDQDYYPELTLVYERYAMELSEPVHIMEIGGNSAMWADQKQEIMNQMLFCDIPEASVPILTQLATLWAAEQGFTF
ncbi:uncharacterized protein BX664DRAFT_357366 [Halteromyces radiatus]|uniref:uncharacterized protein n=1 Tax=Halteromyces radiatus TaxID=101107 RepID=UPI00221F8777|nr:uncharacterized protein BX664DRAFT_357366 [Halteromyces radiatus]KAI8092869.1 hypothetical protein BX664DRAFT_357366 [Halteromyces radiatus]